MKETLEELKVMFKKVNDNADNEISLINIKIEGLKNEINEVECARASLLGELRQKIDEATRNKYKKKWLKQ